MSTKYIKCDCCGCKIPIGSDVWVHRGYCGTYCSAECYAECYGDCETLDEELIEDNGCEVFDDEKRKEELMIEIGTLTEKLAKARFELDALRREVN